VTETAEQRPFRVRARHEDEHHGRVVIEDTFEAAAIAYVEHLPHASGDPSQISVVVQDLQSGHEHCFRIALDGGDAAPC
jgi:hypothetical protein